MRAGRALANGLRVALLAISTIGFATALRAQDATWISPGSTDFNTGANWSTGVVPSGSATAIFDATVAPDLTTSANATVGGFTLTTGAPAYTFANSNVFRFAGTGIVISAGSLSLTNDGTLRFLNSSNAGDATIFNNDRLRFRDSSTAGNATILNSGSLRFRDSSSAGSASITNDGDLEFRNSSTAGNATIINNCCLFFSDTSTAGNATITNLSNLEFRDQSSAGSATISNDGGLFFTNRSSAGSATITNTNTLVFANNSTAGSATIFNTCCLIFQNRSSAGDATIYIQDGGHTFFFNNASGGNARFIVNAGGQLDISGLATAGTTVGAIEGAGSIVLGDRQLAVGALNTSTIFSGVIEGPGGSLVKVGSGALTLSGANTYTGPTTVDGGTLVVNGSLVSDVTVNAGASLMGTGQLAALNIRPGAVHAPGNSIGTQTVNGAYVNSGTLQIETNAAGQADRIIVNGGVDITGAILQVVATPGAYGPSQQYLIIQNNGAGATTGNFALLTSNFAFLVPTVTTTGGDGNDVVLTLSRNDAALTDVARTPNQRAVARALQAGFSSDAGSDGALVINSLLMLSADGARAAYDLMSGEIHASIAHVFFGQSRQLTSLASERLWGAAPQGAATLQDLAMMGLGSTPGEAYERMSLGAVAREQDGDRPRASRMDTWVRGYGDFGRINADGNAERLQSRTGGIVAGGDAPLAPGILVGLMGGWGTSQADVERRTSTADIESGHVAAYARAAHGDLILNALGGYSHHAIDVTRQMAFPGLSRTARSSYGADQATLHGEAGWRWRLGSLGVMPLVALQWSHVRVNGFAETGAGAIDLISNGATFSMLDTIAGVRIGTAFAAGGLTWAPQARVAWTHSFGDVDPGLDLAFAAGGTFVVSGVVREPDMLTLGVGLNVSRGEAAFGFIDYAAHLSDGSREHAVTAGLRVRF